MGEDRQFSAVFWLVESYSARWLRGILCLNLALGPFLHYTTSIQAQAVSLTYLHIVMTDGIKLHILLLRFV